MEIVVTSCETKKITNRGFLLGPYCPIYGTTSLMMLFLLNQYKDDFAVLFVMAVVICTIAEYITSFIMEKMFKARWWDYSHIPFNLNGRVCLSNSVLFGIGAVLLLKFIVPFIMHCLLSFPVPAFYWFSGFLLLLYIIDCCLSFNIIFKFKHTVEAIQRDYTDEISDKVKNIIMTKSYPFRRLIKAFPNQMVIGIKNGIKKGKKILRKGI